MDGDGVAPGLRHVLLPCGLGREGARVEQKAVDCYSQAATVIIPTLIGRPRSRACGRFHVHEDVCNCAKNAFSANTCAWSRLCTQLFVSAELVHFPRERQSSQALVSN